MERRTIDFTQGNILKKLTLFAIPIVLAELLQNLYNTADALVVGNFVGAKALAAVSVCTAISQMVVGFFNGMSIGASVVVSRYFGAGEEERMSASMRTGFASAVLLGTVLSVAGIFATPALIRMISVPPEVYGDAVIYLRIYLAGILFTVIYNVAAGLLRAVGDSRGPFKILAAVCALNVALDVVFVVWLKLGVAGVSIATVISQFISVLAVYARLRRVDSHFRLTFSELRRERGVIADMIGIGMPAGVQNSLILFSNLFVWKYISSFDAVSMAGMGAAGKIDRFVALPTKAFGLALTTYVGQNVGARKAERIRGGVRCCSALALCYSATLGTILFFSAEKMVRLFSSDIRVIAVGVAMMRTLLPFYAVMALREVALGVTRGYGDTKVPMFLSLFGMVVVRQVYLAIALSIQHRITLVFWGYPIAWGATTALTVGYYLLRRRSYEAKLAAPSEIEP